MDGAMNTGLTLGTPTVTTVPPLPNQARSRALGLSLCRETNRSFNAH